MKRVSCYGCGKELFRWPYQIKAAKHNLCSQICRKGLTEYKKQRPLVLCKHCGVNPVKFKHGRNARYCSLSCYGLDVRKPFIIKKGYKRLLQPDHPRSDPKGYVREHIVVMEKKLGRSVVLGEVIHHKDGNKLNNDPANLELFANNSDHVKHHFSGAM